MDGLRDGDKLEDKDGDKEGEILGEKLETSEGDSDGEMLGEKDGE